MKRALIIIGTTAVLLVLVLSRGLLYDAWNKKFGPIAKESKLIARYTAFETAPDSFGKTNLRNGIVPKGYPKEFYPLLSNIGLEGSRYRYPTGVENIDVAYRLPQTELLSARRAFETALGKNGWTVEQTIEQPPQLILRALRGLDVVHVVFVQEGTLTKVQVIYSKSAFSGD